MTDSTTVQPVPVANRESTNGPSHDSTSRRSDHTVLISFTASSIAVTIATTAAAAISLRWLPPAQIGVWQTLVLAQTILGVLRLGVLSGMNRELPFALGAGDHEGARRMAALALAHSITCSLVAFAGFGLLIPLAFGWQAEWRWALSAMALVASSNFYSAYVQSTLRSSADFQHLSRLQIAQALFASAQPLLAYLWGFPGFCVHAAAQAVLLVFLAHRIRPFRVSPYFDAALAGRLLATGVPLFVSGYLQMFGASIDRFVLLWFSGIETLGYFAPVMAVFAGMSVVPGAMVNVFYSRLSFESGRGDSGPQLWRSAWFAVSRAVVLLMPLMIVGWYLIPPLVQTLLPAYTPSIPGMQVALFSGFGLAAATCTTLLGVLKVWWSLYTYVGVLLVTKLIFTTIGSYSSDPVFGVAVGSAASIVLSACVSVWLAYRETHPAL